MAATPLRLEITIGPHRRLLRWVVAPTFRGTQDLGSSLLICNRILDELMRNATVAHLTDGFTVILHSRQAIPRSWDLIATRPAGAASMHPSEHDRSEEIIGDEDAHGRYHHRLGDGLPPPGPAARGVALEAATTDRMHPKKHALMSPEKGL